MQTSQKLLLRKKCWGSPICLPDATCLISTLSLRSFCLFMKIDRIKQKNQKPKPVQLKVLKKIKFLKQVCRCSIGKRCHYVFMIMIKLSFVGIHFKKYHKKNWISLLLVHFTHIIMLSPELFSSCNLRRTENCVSFGVITWFSRKFCRNIFMLLISQSVWRKLNQKKYQWWLYVTVTHHTHQLIQSILSHSYVPIEFLKMPRHTLVISRSDCKILSPNNHWRDYVR